jgi:uncharacterized protein (TIGR03066 family)
MRTLSAAVLGAAVVFAAGTARAQDDTAKKIVGVWEVTKGTELPDGSTLEFTKDGKLTAVVKMDGNELKLEGTYRVEKDKLTVKLKIGEQELEETVTVKKLTDTELEVEDKDKKVEVLKKKK